MEHTATPRTNYVPAVDASEGSRSSQRRSLRSPGVGAAPVLADETRRSSPLSRLHHAWRSWVVLRWKLSRRIFSVSLPFLTAELEVKQGDLMITLPLVIILLFVSALQANARDVGGSGTPPMLTLLLVFGFVVRNNGALVLATGISFERALMYHKLFAFVTVILTALHAGSYVLACHHGEEKDEDSKVVTGTVAFIAMAAILVLSLDFIRRRFFEFFVRMHWILFIAVIIFAVIHGAALALIGFVPWAIDMVYRLVYRARIYSQGKLRKEKVEGSINVDSNENVLSKHQRLGVVARDQLSLVALPGDITHIQFPRVRADTGEEFKYDAGQYAFLCVPTISSLQWHPFTISSSPHESMVTFHIKALGDWTEKLRAAIPQSASSDGTSGTSSPFDILVDGPYGNVSVDVECPTTYSHVALFSGGIGITPMRSIVNRLHFQYTRENRTELKRVHFVWSVKDRETLQAITGDHRQTEGDTKSYFPDSIMDGSAASDGCDGCDAFSSEIYLTRGERDIEGQLDQQLGDRLRYGKRPDTMAILQTIGEEAIKDGKERVAVLVCGPAPLVSSVLAFSIALTKEIKVHFDVHTELFEF